VEWSNGRVGYKVPRFKEEKAAAAFSASSGKLIETFFFDTYRQVSLRHLIKLLLVLRRSTHHGSALFMLLAYASSLFNPSLGESASPNCFTIALPMITPSAPHSAI
jgi:hypothetical protein